MEYVLNISESEDDEYKKRKTKVEYGSNSDFKVAAGGYAQPRSGGLSGYLQCEISVKKILPIID